VGVSHMTGQLIEKIKATQPELGITDNEVRCLKIAGLCHDLGHGPFSHVFDSEFIRMTRSGFSSFFYITSFCLTFCIISSWWRHCFFEH